MKLQNNVMLRLIKQAILLSVYSLIMLFFLFGPVKKTFAAVKTWNPAGCGSTSWNTAGNWTGGLPGTADVATFNGATSNCNVTIDTTIDVAGINITGSYTGTIAQGNGNDINIRASGYTQNASGSTFTGGDSTSDFTLDGNNGSFTLTTGTFNAPAGTTTFSGNYTYSAGTFNANGGTAKFMGGTATYTLTGSTTFNNLIFDDQACNGCSATYSIASGTTLTANGTLTLQNLGSGQGGCEITGTGGITAKGDITIAGSGNNYGADGCSGDGVITVNGSGTQTITGTADDHHFMPGININKSTGTLNFVNTIGIHNGSWAYTAGTLNMGTSRVVFKCGSNSSCGTISGSMTFYQLTFDANTCNGCQVTYVIGSGTTLGVSNTLTFTNAGNTSSFCEVDGPGGISAQGDISLEGSSSFLAGCYGTAVVTINGTGSQTLTGASNINTMIPAVNINKPSGTLTLVSTIGVDRGWTYTAGTVNAGLSTIYMNATTHTSNVTLSGSMTFNNLTFDEVVCNGCQETYIISSGTVLTVAGTLKFDNANTSGACCGPAVDGPGTITVLGDITTADLGGEGTVAITLSGGSDQTITPTGTGFPDGTLTINKSAGTVSLGANLTLNGSGQDLVISAGVLNLGSYNLTVNDVLTISGQLNQTTGTVTAGTVSIGSKGVWINNSDGDVVLGSGGVSNAGYLRFDGSGPLCGGADTIAITSSSGGSSRYWSGTGTTTLIDVNATDQSSGGTGSEQSNTGVSSLTTTSFPANNGDLLIATVTWDNGGGATASISDSVGTNTWSTAVAKQTDGRHAQSMQTFYAKNITGSPNMTVTVTLSVSSSFVRIIAHSVANIDTTSPLDQTAHIENEAGTAVSVGPVTTTANGEYIFAAATDDSGTNTWSADSPFTERVSISSSGTEMQTQDYVQPSSGSISSTWTLSGTNDALAQMATFKNNGGTPAISGSVTAYSSTNNGNTNWVFNAGCPAYSNRSTVNVTGGTKISAGTKLKSN